MGDLVTHQLTDWLLISDNDYNDYNDYSEYSDYRDSDLDLDLDWQRFSD